MIKLIAIDIDGTLLNGQRELTETVKNALIQAKTVGIKVVLCTGRPLKGVQDLLKALTLTEDNHYVITYNGSLVQTVTGSQTIASFSLSSKQVEEIRQVSDNFKTFYHAIDQEYIYTTNNPVGKYTHHESELVNMPIKQLEFLCELGEEKVFQKAMIVDEPDVLDRVIEQLPKSFTTAYYTVKSSGFYLEVLNPQANKGNAVRALAEHLGIDLSEVMAIGDNANDIDMLKVAGVGVAMGNASDMVKSYADFITKSNDEDGVAYAVEHFIN